MSGFDPSRAAESYLVGQLDERKAISRYLSVRAARAVHHGLALPWWAFIRRARSHWAAACQVVAAREIEEGAHANEQAVWLVELNDGLIFAREGILRDSGSDPAGLRPEGAQGEASQSGRSDSEGIAQTLSQSPPPPSTKEP